MYLDGKIMYTCNTSIESWGRKDCIETCSKLNLNKLDLITAKDQQQLSLPFDLAIEMGLARVEAGAQGEHKLARGYLPTETSSLHWVADPGFRTAIEQYLDAEGAAVDEEIEILTSYGPFKKTQVEEQE